ncbi:DUF4402 domain-containing protein [Sphingoaurantiacus capsulatus]|uniref:DUF4402 domain-containing protein n=1 Tax=Sphingoaurantiacus capsulatus TaxID=1771310 RepID=A0ABV7X7N5_9SPHN
MRRLRYLLWLVGLMLYAGATPAAAQTIAIQSITALALGNVAAATSGLTTFTINPSTGAVTKTGGGARITTTTPVRFTVTVRCTGTVAQCDGATVNVRVGNTGTSTLRADPMVNFTVASGTATLVSAPAAGSPISFQLQPIGRNVNKTFFVGGDLPVEGDESAAASGAATSQINVRVSVAPAPPATPGTDSNATMTVYRSLKITKVSDLNFGSILKPTATGGNILVNATTGARTKSAGDAVLIGTAASRAQFTVDGEGGRVIGISVSPANPVTLTRVGGSQTLALTWTRSPTGNLTLSGAAGAAGTGTFGIGGSIPLTTTTTTGQYNGTINITFNYN